MSVEIRRDPMTGSTYLRNGGVKVKLDPMVADAFAELQASTSSLEVARLSRLLDEESEKHKRLEAENAKLREVARELRANLCNRETLLELLGMPSTAETKAAMEDLFNRCDELGVD